MRGGTEISGGEGDVATVGAAYELRDDGCGRVVARPELGGSGIEAEHVGHAAARTLHVAALAGLGAVAPLAAEHSVVLVAAPVVAEALGRGAAAHCQQARAAEPAKETRRRNVASHSRSHGLGR